MHLGRFRSLKFDGLRSFLRPRGLQITGVKYELFPGAFVATENNLPTLRTAVEVETDIAKEYHAKLTVEDALLPDPSALVRGWHNETCGVKVLACNSASIDIMFLCFPLN